LVIVSAVDEVILHPAEAKVFKPSATTARRSSTVMVADFPQMRFQFGEGVSIG